ncbi:putative ribonuclease H-like domain-containing protein [Tanacetum coccineum]|uniref:Ribonuclease H-like domain-containing protein n=1 Tax=Tanacetum coccineum TaxID=301880 RepID=A0ABQ5JAB7_9ASTR
MLDRTYFESWQQRIRLYCLGKDNGENIMKSINEGPFHMGTVSDVIAGGTEGAVQQGSQYVLESLTTFQLKKRKGIKLTFVQTNNPASRYTKMDINSLINHYKSDAKDIEVPQPIMITLALVSNPQFSRYPTHHPRLHNFQINHLMLDNFQLTRSSSTENLIEILTNTLALLTQSYKSHLPQTNNQLRTSSNARNKATVQDGRVVVSDVREDTIEQSRKTISEETMARGNVVGWECRLNKNKLVRKATEQLFAILVYQMETHRRNSTLGKLDCVKQWRPTERICLSEMCPLTKLSVKVVQVILWVSGLTLFKTYDWESFKAHDLWKVHRNKTRSGMIHFWSLSWVYGDYVIGAREISRVKLRGGTWTQIYSLEDLGKFQAKADIGIFVGYAPSRKGYRIYNKRTRRLMETIHVTFDEMHQKMAPVRLSSGPEPFIMTPGQLKSGLAPTDKELEMLFQPMFDEYLEQSRVNEPYHLATEVTAQGAPLVRHQGIAEEPTHEDSPINHDVLHPLLNPVTGEPGSAQSSSGNVNSAEPYQVNQPPDHLRRWTKDHPLDNIVGNPSRPVSTRKQLASDALWCCFHTELSKVEPKNFKMAVIEDCWFQAMQDEIHEFDR